MITVISHTEHLTILATTMPPGVLVAIEETEDGHTLVWCDPRQGPQLTDVQRAADRAMLAHLQAQQRPVIPAQRGADPGHCPRTTWCTAGDEPHLGCTGGEVGVTLAAETVTYWDEDGIQLIADTGDGDWQPITPAQLRAHIATARQHLDALDALANRHEQIAGGAR